MTKLKPGMRIKCNSEDEAKEFIKLAYKQGFKRNDGTSKDNFTAWDKSDDYKIYFLNNDMTITFSKRNYSFFTENLINYSDLKKGEYATMTKKDLENGMVVELRNKGMYLVHNDRLLNEKGIGHMNLYAERGYYDEEYNEDLTRPNDSNWDIIRVYKADVYSLKNMFDKEQLEIIWERKEQPKLSEKDKKKIIKGFKVAQEHCKKQTECRECEMRISGGCMLGFDVKGFDLDKLFKD